MRSGFPYVEKSFSEKIGTGVQKIHNLSTNLFMTIKLVSEYNTWTQDNWTYPSQRR